MEENKEKANTAEKPSRAEITRLKRVGKEEPRKWKSLRIANAQ